MTRHLMRMDLLHVSSVLRQTDTQKRKHTIVTTEIFNAKDVLGNEMQEVKMRLRKILNRIGWIIYFAGIIALLDIVIHVG